MLNTAAAPILYHFPISHFSEKARWAFDYKGIPYRSEVLLPGTHRLVLNRVLRGQKTVPVAVWGSAVVSGSGRIIDELDKRYPQRPLTPSDPELKAEAQQWESFLERDVGVAARRIFYHHALKYPKFVVAMYAFDGPWWGRLFYSLLFGRVAPAVKRMYRITPENVEQDWVRLRAALDRVQRRFEEQEYLVGDGFTRADLTLAALTGPVLGAKTGLKVWPADELWPTEVLDLFAPLRQTPALRRVAQLYREYRGLSAG